MKKWITKDICAALFLMAFGVWWEWGATLISIRSFDNGLADNAKKLTENFPNLAIIFRTPVIPHINDNREEIMYIVKFLQKLHNIRDYELLPYHGFGAPKYEQIGREYALAGEPSMNKADVIALNAEARSLLAICATT